jgi:hypothetical protein
MARAAIIAAEGAGASGARRPAIRLEASPMPAASASTIAAEAVKARQVIWEY